MSWNLQQITGSGGPTVPGEYVACPQAPTVGGGPSSPFVCTFGNQQHFTYLDDNGNMQDVWYDGDANQWNLQQINGGKVTTVPGEYVACPQAQSPNATDPFVCTFGNQQHFTCLDDNGNMQDVWYDGDANQWNLQQINGGNVTSVPGEYVACPQAAAAASRPFVCTFGNQQHFTYLDDKRNLQDVWYDGDANQWNLQQINGGNVTSVPGEYVACPQAPAAGLPAPGSLFVCTFGNQQHFTYFDGNGNMQDCWYDGDANQWHLQQINGGNVTSVPGEYVACPQAPAPAVNSSLFVCTFGNQQHFTYIDINNNIQDCWYDGDANQWNLQQINGTYATTVPGEYVACPQAHEVAVPASLFVCTFGNQQHFTYIDGNDNLQDVWYDGDANQWNLQQINGGSATTVSGEYVACPQAPTAFAVLFVSAFGNQQHFTYLDNNLNLQDCWWG